MRRILLFLAAILAAANASANQPFAFAALGCMPYGLPATAPAFERVIAAVNAQQVAFTVHLGDTKGGAEPITDALLVRIRDYFNDFQQPLVYTPGDNEWTDVHRPSAGGHDPLVWLAKIRQVYFAEERSLGANPRPLVTQRRDPQHALFVENARWTEQGVHFATLHVVGSNNNHSPEIPGALDEFHARDAANRAWLAETFRLAREANAPGIVLFLQANPFAEDYKRPVNDSGFVAFIDLLEAEARAFAKPVLIVHADEHRYRYDRAHRFQADRAPVPNVTRLGVFGARDLHAVLVVVNPASPDLFLPAPLIVPGNPLPLAWTTAPR